MNEIHLVKHQLEQEYMLINSRAERIYSALEELREMTVFLLSETYRNKEDVDNWVEGEGFGIDQHGFFSRLPVLEQFKRGVNPVNNVSHFWPPYLSDNDEIRFRIFALRNIGAYLQKIHKRIGGIGWIYYQDLNNFSIQYPYIIPGTALTPDFDWTKYHTFQSVEPAKNPERKICWTPPTIDYTGEGLILSVSIPIYLSDTFMGLWSIDVMMNSFISDLIPGPIFPSQFSFIADYEGIVLVHEEIESKIENRKGSVYVEKVESLGSQFKNLRLADVIKKGEGELELTDRDGKIIILLFKTIPEIKWILFMSISRSEMTEVMNRNIKEAFEHIKTGDLSHRISAVPESEHTRFLVESYNEMAATLEKNEASRLKTFREREELIKQLESKNSELERFTYTVSHDLKSPLITIRGFLGLLLEDLTDNDMNKINRDIEYITGAVDKMEQLLEELLELSRIGRIVNPSEEFTIKSLVEEILNLKAEFLKQKGVEVEPRLDDSVIFGDRTRLGEVVENLIDNAVKFMGDQPRPKLVIGTRTIRNKHYYYISDNGIGIEPKYHKKIFELFEKLDKTSGGTGIGLAIVKRIIEHHNCSIWVESEGQGKGTTFYFDLPGRGNDGSET